VAGKDKTLPEIAAETQPNNPAVRALIFEYATNIENINLKTEAIAKYVGLKERMVRHYLTPEFWAAVRDERRKIYAKHAVFVDEGLVRSAAKGNPAAAKLFYERHEEWSSDGNKAAANLQAATWIERAKEQAINDIEYHRKVLYNSPLYKPEIEAIQLVEKHIEERSGKVLTIRSARQTMKNECSAMIAVRVLEKFKDKGGTYIRTAPTWKPQIINSKMRLERFLMVDPLIKDDYRSREGFIFQCGLAQIHFLSTDTSAKVVGDTADICLDIDEAHKVDKGKFEEDFSPMTASSNAPVVMWGVAADKNDLLYEYIQHNLEHNPDCVLQYPASVWCELLPQYAKHYEERVAKLGPDHPVILTQYDLVDVDAIGGFFTKHQQTSLFSSDHQQYSAPKDGLSYGITIDIGGEAEEEECDPLVKSEGGRDSTVALIWEVDFDNIVNDYPMCRLVDIHWWTGKSLGDEPSGLPGQQTILLKLLKAWGPHYVVVDGRGVGEQIANYLNTNWGVEVYKASATSVSDDCYGLKAMINNDRVKVFRDDQSEEYQEMVRQIQHTGYEIRSHDLMRIIKPKGKGHIDIAKAITYLPRLVMGGGAPAIY
jgi:hypothetical protein